MRAWSCANEEATAPSVPNSCFFHFLPRKLTKPSTPVVSALRRAVRWPLRRRDAVSSGDLASERLVSVVCRGRRPMTTVPWAESPAVPCHARKGRRRRRRAVKWTIGMGSGFGRPGRGGYSTINFEVPAVGRSGAGSQCPRRTAGRGSPSTCSLTSAAVKVLASMAGRRRR